MKYLALFLLIVVAACKKDTPANSTQPALKSVTTQKNDNDTLIVTEECAVIYTLSDKRLAALKEQLGEEDFYTSMDDINYYMSEAKVGLDSIDLKKVSTNKRVLKFVRQGKTDAVINLDTVAQYNGIYLFDPPKAPAQADITDIHTAVKEYMAAP